MVPVRADDSTNSPTILVLGDSLSAAYGIPLERSWVNLLAQRLRDQGYPYRIVNASTSGETSRGGLDRLTPVLITHRPSIVVVELGANDGLRGLPLEEMARNLIAIVKEVHAHGARVLLVSMRLPPNYGPTYNKQFEAVYDRVAAGTRATLAPFLLQGVAGKPEYIQDDGLHPNAESQPLILENLWPALEPLLSQSARRTAP